MLATAPAPACPGPGSVLNPHLKAVGYQFADRIRGERHTLFIGLDLSGYTDTGHRGRQNGMGHGGRSRLFNVAQTAAIGSRQPLPNAWALTISNGAAVPQS